MKLFTKVSAGFLLSFGFLFLMVSLSELPNLDDKDKTSQERQEGSDAFLGGIAFGMPMLAGGGWIFWDLRQKHQKQLQDRLKSTFYRLIEEKNGQITLLQFAKEAEITGEEAKQYLDTKAKEFNATFDLNPDGGVYYRFHL